MPNLLANATATGASQTWGGGAGQFEATATAFGGATVSLQRRQLDGAFADVSGTGLTANGRIAFSLPPGSIRAAVAGGPPTGVSAAALRGRNA